MTLKEAFDYSFSFLNANGIDEPDFKALTVCCHIAGIRNSEYHFNKGLIISDKKLDDCLWRLKFGEPLQYIIGKWDFYDSEFYVRRLLTHRRNYRIHSLLTHRHPDRQIWSGILP